MSAMKLVIFDLDGTLIDTASLFVGSIGFALESMEQPIPDEKTIRSVSGLGVQVGIRRIAPGLRDAQIDELISRYRKEMRARAANSTGESLFNGAHQTLVHLKNRADMLISVATGKSGRDTDRVLKVREIFPLFTSIHTPDTNRSKPDPDMVHTAMEIANCDHKNTLMIGDTVHDINMAVAAGVKSIGVSWGYHLKEELLQAGADIVIDDFDVMIATIDDLLGDENA